MDGWTLLLLLNAASSWMLCGLIWFVQIVHYPLFDAVGPEGYATYQKRHVKRTGPVVLPPMLVELVTSVLLCWSLGRVSPALLPAWAAWTGLGLVGLIWASTFMFQVPQHMVLESGFHAVAHRRLVVSNWIRTIGWSARALLMGWVLAQALS